MKKIIRVIILSTLPVLFFLLSLICKVSKGELYLNNYYDPSYVYLMNSLNLAQMNGYGVGHIDHPGTTVHVMGALIIYSLHFISSSNKDIVTDVFNRPEFYLSCISLVFTIMNSIALLILGFVSFKKLNDLYSAVFLQLTPIFLITIYIWINPVSPEPMLIFTVLLLITAAISYSAEVDLNTMNIIKYVIIFGVICGFGITTKISFFPLLIIPIILIKKYSFKILFCLVTILVFSIFVIPAISGDHVYKFLNWVRKLTLYSGKYGGGEKSVVDFNSVLKNLNTIFTNEPIFCYSYLLIAITSAFLIIPKFRQKIKTTQYHRLLIGVFAAISIQIFIVCKHFELHYLLPAYMLVILGLYLVNSIWICLFPALSKIKRFLFLSIIIIVFLFFQIKNFLSSVSYVSKRRSASHEVISCLDKNYIDQIKVGSYGSSSKQFALHLGVVFGGSQKKNYNSILKNIFPNNYYYDKWSKSMENVEGINVVKDKLVNSKKFVFQCDNESTLDDFVKYIKELTNEQNITVKKVFSNFSGEMVYEINLD